MGWPLTGEDKPTTVMKHWKWLTPAQQEALLRNGRASARNQHADPVPVVKLFGGPATWLLTELDPEDEGLAFGLCDLGLGFPELGYVYLPELEELAWHGMPLVERDLHFEATHPLSVYAEAARRNGSITEQPEKLSRAAALLASLRKSR